MMETARSLHFLDRSRAGFRDGIAVAELRELTRNQDLKTLQANEPVAPGTWRLLDREFFSQRPDVALRVYGHYVIECDLAFCADLHHVRHFLADCLMHARNVDAIGEIKRLETLSIGIYESDSLAVLERVPASLSELSIGWTRSRKPDLAPLARFKNLERLYLEGHTTGIEAIGSLEQLRRLTLRSITTSGVDYLVPLEHLWSLDIKLGGIRSLTAIEGKASIKHLELWQIRGFSDLRIVSRLPGLQNLFLQSLRQVTKLPALDGAARLRRIVLQNMGGLRDLDALADAPALEELLLLEGRAQDPEDLKALLSNRAVRCAGAFFGSNAKNGRFEQLRVHYGKQPWEWHEFEYR